MHRDSVLIRSNEMQQYATTFRQRGLIRPRWRKVVALTRDMYDLYQKLQLQFDVLLMMGAIDTRNM